MPVLSFHHVGPESQIHVAGLGGKQLHLLSYLAYIGRLFKTAYKIQNPEETEQ